MFICMISFKIRHKIKLIVGVGSTWLMNRKNSFELSASAHYFRRLGSFFICWEIDTAQHTVSLSLSIWYTLINYLSKQIKYTENTATFSTHSISLSKSWDFVAGLLVKTELFAINPKKSGFSGHCTSCCWFLLLEDFLSLQITNSNVIKTLLKQHRSTTTTDPHGKRVMESY